MQNITKLFFVLNKNNKKLEFSAKTMEIFQLSKIDIL